MVDLTPNEDGSPRARLLDLVPGRSGKVCGDCFVERGKVLRDSVEVATLDPFHGYENAIDDQPAGTTAVLTASTSIRDVDTSEGHHRYVPPTVFKSWPPYTTPPSTSYA